jgi:putative nucleotidyltransferase with HDIG domain
MKLANRAFLVIGLPILGLIAGSFWAMNQLVRKRVTEDLGQSLARTQLLIQAERVAGEQNLRQSLAVLTESAGLKASMALLRELQQSGALAEGDARRQIQGTLDAQLRDLRQILKFDLYVLADGDGKPRAALPKVGEYSTEASILAQDGRYYSVVTVPINRELETLGYVTVGTRLNFADGYYALMRDGRSLETSLPGFAGVSGQPDQIVVGGETYVASYERRGEYLLASFRPVEAAVAPALAAQRGVMLGTFVLLILVSLFVASLGARSVTRPLVRLSGLLDEAGRSGRLPAVFPSDGGVWEVRVLMDAFQSASRAIDHSNQKLEQAYVDFMGAMAEALDARDPYTAGHSRRVADYSVRIARALGLAEEDLERIRIGAMLHDIGKIGVPDHILHKHEKLTDEEFMRIQQHPQIRRRILERVGRFERFLPAVELHHENHDGTGYPHGLRGMEIPIDARIIHVADAYDAMTSDRPYRKRMPEDKVRRILRECSGTQFDPRILDVFLAIRIEVLTAISDDLEKLSNAITAFQQTPGDGDQNSGPRASEPAADGARVPDGAAHAGADICQRVI